MTFKQKLHKNINRLAKRMGTSYAPGYPSALMVEPTNYCNLTCTLCPTGSGWLSHPQGRMDGMQFYKLMDEAGPYLERVAFWNWGEPFLHHGLLDMVRYARRFPVWLQVCTNGHFFDDPSFVKEVAACGLNQVIVSVDGATTESLRRYRGPHANLEIIMRGIQNFVTLRDEMKGQGPLLEMQFLMMKHNQDEVEAIEKMARALRVDRFYIKTINMRPEDLAAHAALLPDDEKYRRFVINGQGEWTVKGEPTGICPYVYQTAVVLWDGSLLPCCFDAEEKVTLGNAFQEGLHKAWNNPAYRRFRHAARHRRAQIPMCAWCPEERRARQKRLGRFWTDLD